MTSRKDEGGEVVDLTAGDINEEIREAVEKIRPLRAANRANNSKISEIKAGLEEHGITRRAFERAYQDLEMREADGGGEKIAALRTAEAVCKDALGIAQGDLFQAAAE